ncbi:MAG: hypothetical protein ACK5LN_12655 [Propioniciclava sp.]
MRRTITLFTAAFMSAVVVGCGVPADETSEAISASVPADTRGGLLDWTAATVTLPLDAFGMSSSELRTLRAAISIAFARCVTGEHEVSNAVVSEAARSLEPLVPDADAHHWLYGIWNAPFVAEHGWFPFPGEDPEPMLVETDQATADRCFNSDVVRALNPISPAYADEGPSSTLVQAGIDSRARTLATTEYQAIMDELEGCLIDAGYAVSRDEELAQIDVPESATEEQRLTSMVAAATCNDDNRITQRAADIEAGFQASEIAEREAEFQAVRAVAAERVASAHQILNSVGL